MTALSIVAGVEFSGHLNVILLFGVVILGGTFASKLFQLMHIPQVVGCIFVGVLLGDVFRVISPQMLEYLEPFTMFALGVIGFMIGSELRGDIFRKYGRQFFVILFSQGLGAFILVTAGVSLLVYMFTEDIYLSVAMGMVLGAIASATAPAATVNVLWEYKTRGPLTVAVLAIVALDDALALLLYRGAATGAKAVMGIGEGSAMAKTLFLFGEILGAVLLGFLAGVTLYWLLKLVRADDKILSFGIGSLLIVVGISIIPDIDPILPAMVFGITLANLAPRQSKGTFSLVERFSPPVYTSFFVLAGAHMEFAHLNKWIIGLICVYILTRAIGKMAGSWLGARWSHAPAAVRKYLGLCLLPQAGVAIGLAILASGQFNDDFGKMIILTVMTGTFLMEIFGPMLVKVGVKKAGEVGLNITEDDLIKVYKVSDVMDTDPTVIDIGLPLPDILDVFGTNDSVFYPVVDNQHKLAGQITITDIKDMFANRDVGGWLLAMDVTEPVQDKTFAHVALEEVFDHMRRVRVDYIPVVESPQSDKLVGLLDYSRAMRKISAEVLNRRKTADGMAFTVS